MSDFINYLQHRVEETKRDLENANQRMQQAMADRDMLGAELQGYERALAAEMRRQGIAVPPTQNQQDLPLEHVENGSEDGTVNKAEFARRFIRGRADIGATPADIMKGFQDAGIPIKKPYVYALVQRLQKTKPPAIKAKRGKWFPILESEQQSSASGTGTAGKDLP